MSSDDLTRVFNTAIVATQAPPSKDFSSELYKLVKGPAFDAILGAVKQLSQEHGLSERQAAEQIIETFRRLDRIWSDYVFKEGVDRLRSQQAPGNSVTRL